MCPQKKTDVPCLSTVLYLVPTPPLAKTPSFYCANSLVHIFRLRRARSALNDNWHVMQLDMQTLELGIYCEHHGCANTPRGTRTANKPNIRFNEVWINMAFVYSYQSLSYYFVGSDIYSYQSLSYYFAGSNSTSLNMVEQVESTIIMGPVAR